MFPRYQKLRDVHQSSSCPQDLVFFECVTVLTPSVEIKKNLKMYVFLKSECGRSYESVEIVCFQNIQFSFFLSYPVTQT